MGKHYIIISMLACKDCGSRFPIPRKSCSLREHGHIKDLWCYKCKRVTKFIEKPFSEDVENRFAVGVNNPSFT